MSSPNVIAHVTSTYNDRRKLLKTRRELERYLDEALNEFWRADVNIVVRREGKGGEEGDDLLLLRKTSWDNDKNYTIDFKKTPWKGATIYNLKELEQELPEVLDILVSTTGIFSTPPDADNLKRQLEVKLALATPLEDDPYWAVRKRVLEELVTSHHWSEDWAALAAVEGKAPLTWGGHDYFLPSEKLFRVGVRKLELEVMAFAHYHLYQEEQFDLKQSFITVVDSVAESFFDGEAAFVVVDDFYGKSPESTYAVFTHPSAADYVKKTYTAPLATVPMKRTREELKTFVADHLAEFLSTAGVFYKKAPDTPLDEVLEERLEKLGDDESFEASVEKETLEEVLSLVGSVDD